MDLAEIRKALVTGVGSLLTVFTFVNGFGFLPANLHTVVGVCLAVLTTVSTWLIPNKTA